MSFSKHVKSELLSIIDEINSVSWMYSKNPEVDFSKMRKMDFKSTSRFILSLESSSSKTELFKYFKFNQTTPSVSAFSQQRNKILIGAFKFLFYEFNCRFDQLHLNALFDLCNKRYVDVDI